MKYRIYAAHYPSRGAHPVASISTTVFQTDDRRAFAGVLKELGVDWVLPEMKRQAVSALAVMNVAIKSAPDRTALKAHGVKANSKLLKALASAPSPIGLTFAVN